MESVSKNILLANDFPGYGKVALAAMTPILSRMGHYVFQLPTAVVSNTLDFGKFRMQDMTSYMKGALEVWQELGFEPDCICTGFITSGEQGQLLGEYIQKQKREKGNRCLVVVDPIMADCGKLYNGIGPDRIWAMKRLAAMSDVMVPNITEASFLTGIRPGQESGSPEQVEELVDGLKALSGKSVVITSVTEKNAGKEIHCVYGYDHFHQEPFRIPYEHLPVRVAGSGDIFSALMVGGLLAGNPLKDAITKTVKTLSALIAKDREDPHGYKGILIEKYEI
ncbi:MAG: phosphomethylpyrimidine kinase [Lachnospiraceae bacterium]|nr:phosphomethylpyrimidine kinase [Lachnospiraceae bacterium]